MVDSVDHAARLDYDFGDSYAPIQLLYAAAAEGAAGESADEREQALSPAPPRSPILASHALDKMRGARLGSRRPDDTHCTVIAR